MALDRKGKAGAILTDISKAFDCLNHKLLLAKMDAYGFDKSALLFTQSYLHDRKQGTRVMVLIALGWNSCLESPRGLYLDHYFSIFS